MQKFPDANLTLIGCNDGYSTEKNNRDLSGKRAIAVKDYLIKNWNISESRNICSGERFT